jgi:hypothetical protein
MMMGLAASTPAGPEMIMGELGRFDILLLVVAAFVAVTTLVKLMRARRDLLVAQVQQQMDQERERRKRETKLQEQQHRSAA